MKEYPYQEVYSELQKALRDGAKIHIFRSGGGLRVVRLVKGKKCISYGEYPNLSGALAHAESDFGLSYNEQYGGENAKHEHYLTGAYPRTYDPIDMYIQGGHSFDIFYSKKWEEFVCITETPSELNRDNEILWGASPILMAAISLCLISFKSEDKKSFMKRV